MVKKEKTIYVYADCFKTESKPRLVGNLYVSENRGKETFSFEYDKLWLKEHISNGFFDPDLYSYAGRQYVPNNKQLFGIFSDSCPDRWGRTLINRREALLARKENRKPRKLTESDYLLGVYDETRIGGLRFSLREGGPFLSNDASLTTPPWTTLRSLEESSRAFETGGNEKEEEKWLNQLLAPGSSLGGARPKASVEAPDGSLWIAKFPSKHDEWNTGAWEMVIHDLAIDCGLNVPEAKLEIFSEAGGTFLVKRFDRKGKKRIHFSSAMSLLGKTDGNDDSSYLDIATFIRSNGASPSNDLKELWKRIIFNIAVSNTDDHLRNHGFLFLPEGWRLSPLFDVNPSIYGDSLSLLINEEDATMDFYTAIDTAEYYGINKIDAEHIINTIKKTIEKNWKKTASKYGLSRNDIIRMEPAFSLCDS